MNCPKCNRENDPDASICPACGIELPQTADTPGKLEIRTSELAIISCILALITPLAFVLSVAGIAKEVLGVAWLFTGLIAFILGVAALLCIERSSGRLTGKGFAAIGVAIPLCLFFFVIFIDYSIVHRRRSVAYRLYCGTNLSGIGKAMLIYSNDYDDELPRAGGKNTRWGPTPDWKANTPAEAYGLGDGQASISASFFLLVKYAEVTPRSFVCIGDKDKEKGGKATTEFTLGEYNIRKDMLDLFDFGPDPSKHCSYTYHLPYVEHGLTASSDPRMAVAADRNPWLDTYARKARAVTEWAGFDPNGTRDAVKLGNAFTHQEDGQNVLYVDGHTSFEKNPACGVKNDNIYTSHEGEDIEKGTLPTITSRPENRNDSLLLHDPPKGAKK